MSCCGTPLESFSGEEEEGNDCLVRRRLTNKVVVLGDSSVGKTSLIQRYRYREFRQTTATQLDYADVELCGVRCQLWDTAGQEIYDAMSAVYLRDTDVVIVCYSLNSEVSRLKLGHWIDKALRHADNPLILIVATKTDLVSAEEAEESVSKVKEQLPKALIFPCSSLEGTGVDAIFDYVGESLASKAS